RVRGAVTQVEAPGRGPGAVEEGRGAGAVEDLLLDVLGERRTLGGLLLALRQLAHEGEALASVCGQHLHDDLPLLLPVGRDRDGRGGRAERPRGRGRLELLEAVRE